VSRFAIRLTTLAIFSMALIAAPIMTPAFASAGDPPVATDSKAGATDSKTKRKSGEKGSSIDPRMFNAGGYRPV
jgi:hypothetical protein